MKITVTLTEAECNALRDCASGELESLTAFDWKNESNLALANALTALDEGRKKAAQRERKPKGGTT